MSSTIATISPTKTRGLSIRGKVLIAFLLLSGITAAVGLNAYRSLSRSAELVSETYDRPLMAISFARQVLADFSRLEAAFLRRLSASSPSEIAALDASKSAREQELADDLNVVAERVTSERLGAAVERVRAAIEHWRHESDAMLASGGVANREAVDRASATVNEQIDLLVNYAAGDGFRARQSARSAVETNAQLQLAGTIAALALALAVALQLIRRIVGPVAAASSAADRIAHGELNVEIPMSGRDELASLLGSMAIMRDNIRAMMDKEINLRRLAQIRLVDAIESSSEGVIVVDPEGKIAIANAEAQRCFAGVRGACSHGSDFDRLIAAAVNAGVFVAPKAEEKEDLVRRLTHGDGTVMEELLADGRWMLIVRNRTSEGGVIAMFSDITQQKHREAELREARDKAEAGSRTKTEFLANMSHELRTPLNAVIGYSELMESEALGPLGQPKYKEFLGDVLGSARRLLAIINNILEWSKLDAGRSELDIGSIDVAAVVDDCRKAAADMFESAKVTFAVDVPSSLRVNADRAKLERIIMNLLSNAAKFTPAGGSAWLRAHVATKGQVRIEVGDTGIGMKAEDIQLALSPFGQIDSRLARKYEGTGLGLALAKALTDRHHALFSIESEPGRGTVVALTFTAADTATAGVPGVAPRQTLVVPGDRQHAQAV